MNASSRILLQLASIPFLLPSFADRYLPPRQLSIDPGVGNDNPDLDEVRIGKDRRGYSQLTVHITVPGTSVGIFQYPPSNTSLVLVTYCDKTLVTGWSARLDSGHSVGGSFRIEQAEGLIVIAKPSRKGWVTNYYLPTDVVRTTYYLPTDSPRTD